MKVYMAVRWSCYIRELCRSGHLRSCSRIYHPNPEPTGNNYGSRERRKAQAQLWEMLEDPPKRWSDKQRNELERLDTVTTPWSFSFLHSYKTDLFFLRYIHRHEHIKYKTDWFQVLGHFLAVSAPWEGTNTHTVYQPQQSEQEAAAAPDSRGSLNPWGRTRGQYNTLRTSAIRGLQGTW